MTKPVRVRYAPSPTGFLHIGGLRTALYNFLFARKNSGKLILRIEDTDQARFVKGSLENILETFADFGILTDEGPYLENGEVKEKGDKGPYQQSKRLDLYHKHAEELIEKKAAYHCFCTAERLQKLRESQEAQKLAPKYDKQCLQLSAEEVKTKLESKEPHVIRLNVPADRVIAFEDLVRGKIEIPSNDVDDQVLLKSDGFPTYHLAVVVDDHFMEISHVLRGEEWIPSTPKHLLLYEAFGWEAPLHAHLPNILGQSGKKLSKRESDVAVKDFIDKGYLKEALLNFIVLLGWNPKTEQEIFTMDELINQFDVAKINISGAILDMDKLDWINGLYIRQLSIHDIFVRIRPYLLAAGIQIENYPQEYIEKVLKLEQERLKKFSEIGERISYFFKEPEYDSSLLIWKKSDKNTILENLKIISEFLNILPADSFKQDQLEADIKKLIADRGLKTGEMLWPLRAALTGLDASPGPFEIMDAFGVLENGKHIILDRVNLAIIKLS